MPPMAGRQGRWLTVGLALLIATIAMAAVLALRMHAGLERADAASAGRTDQTDAGHANAGTGAAAGGSNAGRGGIDDPARRRLWEQAQPHLDWATRESLAQIDPALGQLDRFFTDRLAGAQPFARSALSVDGKVEYLRDAAGAGGRHHAYLQRQFERCLFSPAQLRAAVEGCVADFAAAVMAVDNQLLVRLRADVADGPGLADLPRRFDELGRRYTSLLAGAGPAVGSDVKVAAAREAGSVLAGEAASAIAVRVAGVVAARLGLSAGLMAGGVATSWATFGAGLAAAVLVDRGIDWAMANRGYDPQRRLERLVADNLLDLRTLLIEGDADRRLTVGRLTRLAREDEDESVREAARAALERIASAGTAPGLREELTKLAERHDRLRRQLIRELILGDGR